NLDIPRKEEDIQCLEKENKPSDIDSFYDQFRLPEEKQAELLKELEGNTELPPAITNLMKSELYQPSQSYQAPKPYVWDYELYRKERAHLFTDSDSNAETKITKTAYQNEQEDNYHISELLAKEDSIEAPTTLLSKGLEMLQSIKVAKEVEPASLSDTKEQSSIKQPEAKGNPTTPNHTNHSPSATKPKFEPKLGFQPKLLRDYRFNKQTFDEIRILTGDFELTDDEMIGAIRRIVTDKPDTQIWGGRRAFTNFMVKVMNNQRKAESDEDDDLESIAEMERKQYEKALYNYENRIIEWF
ncbi:MAG: hypothetical protein O3C07_03895, partial [Bacteroidetes bacterium]|nr:hypothetical protein [Bacteroidota bacterium]